MTRLLVALLAVVVVAGPAFGGDNPSVCCYIDFDPPHRVHTISPEPGSMVDAYICLDWLEAGMTTLSFRLTDVMSECPGVFSSYSFENLLPGDLTIGDPMSYEGCTVAAMDCTGPGDICVGVVHLEYVGGGCCIELLDHADYPRWVVDCNDPGLVDLYTTGGHGSIGSACCPRGESVTDVRCEPQGAGNPGHPPTYWYDVELGFMNAMYSFRVRVEDPNPGNYTNWVAPEEWTYGLEQDGAGTWAAWHSVTPSYQGFRFQFDHQSLPTWGHWELGSYYGPNASADMPAGADGCGYRVHVPAAMSPVEQQSWSTIKALYQ